MMKYFFAVALLALGALCATSYSASSQAQPKSKVAGRPVIYKKAPLTTSSRSLKAEMYDADENDGDIASVKFNGKLIVKQVKLNKKYKKAFIIYFKKGRNTLVLWADNLGMMGPNTAAINLYDGKKLVSRLILKSDLKSDGGIIINYKPRRKAKA
jgi:hypothetical protein